MEIDYDYDSDNYVDKDMAQAAQRLHLEVLVGNYLFALIQRFGGVKELCVGALTESGDVDIKVKLGYIPVGDGELARRKLVLEPFGARRCRAFDNLHANLPEPVGDSRDRRRGERITIQDAATT